MSRSLQQIFDLCLEKIREGNDREKVISQYPEYERELRELLSIVAGIEKSVKPDIFELARQRCFARMEAEFDRRQSLIPGFRPIFRFPQILLRTAAVTAVAVVFIFSLVKFSAGTIPGDRFYPLKILIERMRCCTAFTPEKKAWAYCCCAECRAAELEKVFARTGHLDFVLVQRILQKQSFVLDEFNRAEKTDQDYFRERIVASFMSQIKTMEGVLPQVAEKDKQALVDSLFLSRKHLSALK